MSWTATALVAWSGIFGFAGIYYGALHLMRRQNPEYISFAGLCGGLFLYALATAFTVDSQSPAEAVFAQNLQHLGVMPATAFFVDFVLRLTDEAHPRVRAAAMINAALGVCAVLAGLFFDAGVAEPTYDWSHGELTNRAIADMSAVGMAFVGVGVGFAFYGVVILFNAARGRRDLRGAAVMTGIALAGGAWDVLARLLDVTPINFSSHGALLPVLGFSYVLVGRFTQVDRQLEDRTQELARSYDYLRVTQQALVKKEQLAAVGELSAVIAHEVRNPLAIIKNAVSGLRRKELRPDDGETLLAILDEETDRLNRLINDLLAYARPISPEHGEPVDMRRLVMHAVELAAGGSRDISHIEIELELENEVAEVEGAEALLRHALINIVDNALQAMPLGGTLTVSCRDTEVEGRPCVAVEFHDTGEGMDTIVRSRARDPFFTTRQTGTGLGLAIVDRVARAHGGSVSLESRHGQGTMVSFLVPRDRSSIAPPTS